MDKANFKNIVFAPISIGELVDKITILEIKESQISDLIKLENIKKELMALNSLSIYQNNKQALFDYQKELREVNLTIWDLEEKIRYLERMENFNDGFIETSRRIHRANDERSFIKKKINILFASELSEEKSYRLEK